MSARAVSLCFALLLFLTACSGSNLTRQVDAQPAGGAEQRGRPGTDLTATELLKSLPEFPLPKAEATPRIGSVIVNISLTGSSVYSCSEESLGTDFVDLPSAAGETAWAIYRFEGLTPEANVASLNLTVSNALPGLYYILLANYATMRWELQQVDGPQGDSVHPVFQGPAADYISPDGSFFVGALVYDGATITVDALDLTANSGLQAPASLSATDGTVDTHVELQWETVPGADGYDIFYKLEGEGDEAYGMLIQLDGPDTLSFLHSATEPPARPCAYAVHYEYRVRSRAGSEVSAEFSPSDVGFRQTPAPLDFFVSMRNFDDRIKIDGFVHPGALLVELYRDGELLVNLPVDLSFFTYNDFAGDLEAHEYWAVSIGPEGPSPESEHLFGCRGQWVHSHVDAQALGDSPHSDAAMINGRPAVVYWHEDNASVTYAYSDAEQPSSWTKVELVFESAPDARMSLIEYNGLPWFCASLTEPAGVYLTQFTTAEPTSFADADGHFIDTVHRNGLEVRLCEIDGRLAALYYSNDAQSRLYYAFTDEQTPDEQEDWTVSVAGADTVPFTRRFDMADMGNLPAVVFQEDNQLLFRVADTRSADGPEHWTDHQVIGGLDSYGAASGVDLVVRNGLPHIACSWGQLESSGVILYLLPTLPEVPTTTEHWNGGQVIDLNDDEPQGLTLLFMEDKPWIAWQNSKAGTPFLANVIKHQVGYLNGGWYIDQVPGPPEYEQARRESRLLPHADGLGLLFTTDSEAADGQQMVYSTLLPKN